MSIKVYTFVPFFLPASFIGLVLSFFIENKQDIVSPLPHEVESLETHAYVMRFSKILPTITSLPSPTLAIFPANSPVSPQTTPAQLQISTTPASASISDHDNLDNLFASFAREYGVSAELLKKIAQCESCMNPLSHNTTYDYGGMFQFAASSWITTRTAMGLSTDTAFALTWRKQFEPLRLKFHKMESAPDHIVADKLQESIMV